MIAPKTRQRAIRCFVASLLQSDLNNSELRQIALELAKGSLGKELSEIISELMATFPENKPQSYSLTTSEPDCEAAYVLVQERHLTKNMVLQLMKIVNPHITVQKVKGLERKSLRDMLKYFFSSSPPESGERLLGLEENIGDAYLIGISKRE